MLRMMIVGNKMSVLNTMDTLIHLINGITIVSAYSAEEALEILSFDQNFHIILLDTDLPLSEHIKTFDIIKKHNITIPTIIITDEVTRADYQKMFEVGATEYLQKPYSVYDLLTKLEKVTNVSLFEAVPTETVTQETYDS